MQNALSIDVEDYFHPTEVQNCLDGKDWDCWPSRVENATSRVLELLSESDTKATFFVLGWVAERYPHLVRRIAAEGHELACHSYLHQLVYDLTPGQFRTDTLRCKQAIEDACGVSPTAYRAPSYSITRASFWALEVLVELGFIRDSSIYPIHHDRYGIPGFSRFAQRIDTPSGSILEIPVATVKLGKGRVTPVGGGGYLRLLPYRYTAAGMRRLNEAEQAPACMYFHPWELDPDQPRLAKGILGRLRTYSGLNGMEHKIRRLLHDFEFSSLQEVFPVAERSMGAFN